MLSLHVGGEGAQKQICRYCY